MDRSWGRPMAQGKATCRQQVGGAKRTLCAALDLTVVDAPHQIVYKPRGGQMRTARVWQAMGRAAVMLSMLAGVSNSQQNGRHSAPSVRIYSANGVDVINTSSYVMPEIQISENAYLFVVAMDLDGQIQVLHPDFPGLSVKISAHKQLHLPNFFAGFNQQSFEGVYHSAQFQHYTRNNGWGDTRGVAIALASRAPFNLERIEVGGNWDMIALRRMLENRTPQD